MSSKAVELYKHYATAFSAISDQERRDILDSVLETDIIYRIPRMEGIGHQIVIDDIHDFQSKFPGGHFALHSVSEHHDVALMEWQLILPDGTPSVLGHDAIRITPEGKLGQIVTFAPSTLEPQAS
ncbi:MAG: hypothetical protein P4L40_18810 [Terracidiphilus sp.]|nr:hypothetical protein [Terracidiphilus sp.]